MSLDNALLILGVPKHEVPLMQLERAFDVAAAKVQVGGKP